MKIERNPNLFYTVQNALPVLLKEELRTEQEQRWVDGMAAMSGVLHTAGHMTREQLDTLKDKGELFYYCELHKREILLKLIQPS